MSIRRRDKVTVRATATRSSPRREKYVLRLYVTGATPRSTRAITNIRRICEEHLKGRYKLEVIDLYQQVKLARDEQIIAAPTLIKKLPLPLRRIVGDLSDRERVLMGLDVRPQMAAAPGQPAPARNGRGAQRAGPDSPLPVAPRRRMKRIREQ